MISLCAATSSKDFGRYFSIHMAFLSMAPRPCFPLACSLVAIRPVPSESQDHAAGFNNQIACAIAVILVLAEGPAVKEGDYLIPDIDADDLKQVKQSRLAE